MTSSIDYRLAIPGARKRKRRRTTSSIVLHHYDLATVARVMRRGGVVIGDDVDPFEALKMFWTEYIEGIARVTVVPSRVNDVMTAWALTEIPQEAIDAAYVPYHHVIDSEGRHAQFLDDDAVGAHAYGANSTGIAVAVFGNFRTSPPTDAAVLSTKKVVSDKKVLYPDAAIEGHDDVRRRMGRGKKQCPGDAFPLAEIKSWAELRASEIRKGSHRR